MKTVTFTILIVFSIIMLGIEPNAPLKINDLGKQTESSDIANVVKKKLSGSVSGTWSFAESPYLIEDSIYIEEGKQLMVEPGVVVISSEKTSRFDVYGKLYAKGKPDSLINFSNISMFFNSSIDTSHVTYSRFSKDNDIPCTFANSYGAHYGHSAIQNSEGDFLIVGNEYINSDQDYDVCLIKINSRGQKVWKKTYGSYSYDRGFSIQETNDGGYIIASDHYLIKVDSNGDQMWMTAFNGSGYSAQQTSDGGYIAVGYQVTNYPSPYTDVYLVKTNSNGMILWERIFGGNDYDYGNDVQQTNDGGYIITGIKGRYLYLIKTDSSGIIMWEKTFSGYYYAYGYSVQQTNDNGFIIAGHTTTDTDSVTVIGDAYLLKTNTSGEIVWEKTYDFNNVGDYGKSVKQTSDGGFIFSGWVGYNHDDAFLIKTDTQGNSIWSKKYSIIGRLYGNSVQQTIDGGYVIGCNAYLGLDKEYNAYLIKTDDLGRILDNGLTTNYNSNLVIQNSIIKNFNNNGLSINNNSTTVVTNCLIAGNKNGIKFYNSSPQFVINNTIADNENNGLYFDQNSDAQLINNIVYGNILYQVYIYSNYSDPNFYYNNIQGGLDGFGLHTDVNYLGIYTENIDSNPMFSTETYIPSGVSDCIDAGLPFLTYDTLDSLNIPNTDLAGNARIYYSKIDIGCYESQASGVDHGYSVEESALYQNYPNPFNPATTIKYFIQNDANVKINVYDISGREVCKLVDQAHCKGAYQVEFNGEMLASGIYFFRLSIDNKVAADRKMILLK